MESKRTNKLMLKYIELANLKGKILENAKKLSQEELNKKPSENEWSISQVVTHIINSETGVNKYINNKLKTPNKLPRTGIKNFFASKLLNNKLKSEQKLKIPKVLSQPNNGISFDELKENWDKSRLYLINTVENFPKDKMNKAIFKHPVAGKLSINQTLSFMINHLKHHVPQINNLTENLK